MRVTMAQGTRAFQLPEAPRSRFLKDEQGELWVVQQTRQVDGQYEVLCRHATRIEERLHAGEAQELPGKC